MEYFSSDKARDFFKDKQLKEHGLGTVITIGNFDGVHKGHLNLINKVMELTQMQYSGCKSTVLTFNPHPRSFIGDGDFKLIFNSTEKLDVFKSTGIEMLIEYPFDDLTRSMSSSEFVDQILINGLNCKALVIGKDYSFGKNKEGNADKIKCLLSKYGVPVFVLPDILNGNERIGSTRIRKTIESGNMEEAEILLGKPYFVSGEVIHGKELGRQIGFPTMNILPSKDKLVPTNGVYISRVTLDKKTYNSITNIGYNPTVSGKVLITETNVFDFDKSVYGKIAKVEILKKIRDEKNFASIEKLKEQIDIDVKIAKKYFEN